VKPNAFSRLLANLIGNAARYAGNVTVHARVSDHMLTLMVDDDGPGIPPDKREEAFRPFVRLDNARNLDETGTGLGLAIARDIARAHGGDIRLEDSPKGGLRALLQIPV
jgi:two-component system osmolarity sensor histidine kinase EnvZ